MPPPSSYGARQRLELALEGAALATWDWDIATGETFYNQRWFEMLGYGLEDLKADLQFWSQLVHPDDYPRVWKLLRAHLDGATDVYQAEYRLRHKNGQWIWVQSHGKVYQRAPDGTPLHAAGVHQDITQRKEAEEALLVSREMYKNTVELTTQIPWIASPDGAIVACDPVWEAFTGLPLESALNSTWLEIIHPEDQQRTFACWTHSVRSGEPYRVAHRLRRFDGVYRYGESRAQPQRGTDGRILRWYGTAEDIHDRTVAEQLLRASEQRLALALEGAQLATWDWSLRTGQTFRTSRWFEMLGYEQTDAARGNDFWAEKVHPEDLPRVLDLWSQHAAGSIPAFRAEYRIRHKSGEWKWILTHGQIVERDAHGPVRACGIDQDITERRRVEDALVHSEQFSRVLLEGHQDCVTLLDDLGRIVYMNPAGLGRLGIPQPEGGQEVSWIDLWPEDDRETVRRAIDSAISGRPSSFEAFCQPAGAPTGWWNVLLSPLPQQPENGKRVLAVAREITELKKEEQRQQANFERERLQAILENLNEGIIIAEPHGVVLLMNRAAQEMYGFHPEKGKTIHCQDLMQAIQAGDAPDRFFAPDERPLARALRGESFSNHETFLLNRRTGRKWIGSCGSTPVRSATGDLLLAVLSVRDVTAERKGATEIEHANQVLHELSGRLLRIQDDERKQIARELHDGTVQLLSAAMMNLTVLSHSPQIREVAFEQKLVSKTLDHIQQCVKELRTISYLLHPPVLEELGLVPAIRSWIDGFSERSGIPVDIDMPEDLGRLAAEVETALFRITQEALGNVHRHAECSAAAVHLRASGDRIVLEIEDDGKGFEWLPPAPNAMHKFGVGLLGMRERASQLRGSMIVDSQPGLTIIRVTLPQTILSA